MSAYSDWQVRKPRHLAMLASLPLSPVQKATAQLQAESPKAWRSRYDQSDLSAAIRSAAREAGRSGEPVMVTASNRYGYFVWNVVLAGAPTFLGSLSLARGAAARSYLISPDATVSLIDWRAAA